MIPLTQSFLHNLVVFYKTLGKVTRFRGHTLMLRTFSRNFWDSRYSKSLVCLIFENRQQVVTVNRIRLPLGETLIAAFHFFSYCILSSLL